ncbi:MAG: ribulokinase [bacterium]
MASKYVIGVDFGTDSVRSVIFNALNGQEIASSICEYPRWQQGRYCDPNQNKFRQHPLDYIESLEKSIKQSLSQAPEKTAESVKGIGIDTTGSTPCAVDENGNPLALSPDFTDNPNAMFVLWKDHTSVEEAEEINHYARTWGGEDYTKYIGGVYSSEWFWAKMLHIMRKDDKVNKAAYSWVEHCDWMPALLTDTQDPVKIKRSRCAAGHKAMWHASWNGLPPETFLSGLDRRFSGIRSRLYKQTFTADYSAGTLSREWAERLGLSTNVQVSVGAFDAHLGAIGAQIEPYHLCKVMGTSTCDMLIAPLKEMEGKLVSGICGQVDGSILPEMLGMEAGQSSFGDVYAWFKDVLLFAVKNVPDTEISGLDDSILPALSREAEKLPVKPDDPVAVDWLNGRRTPDANQRLKAAVTGLNLSIDAPRFYKSLVESTAFGARAIVDRFETEGVPIEGVIGLGGVSKKNSFVMQTICNVLDRSMRIARSEQTVALGSAMAAATAAGIYPSLEAAQEGMGQGFETTYKPDPARAVVYETLYKRYKQLGHFLEKQTSMEL